MAREDRAVQLAIVDSRLVDRYGRPEWHSHGPPLDELIATVLSQHTSDSNTARAYSSLRGNFPTWVEVVSAPASEVADAIRSGGLADLKAPRIQAILRKINAETGTFSLDWLKGLSLAQSRNWLLALPGVGPKTAACVLLFSLGLPAFPVDTHVYRVTRRLGLIEPNVSASEAHAALERMIGPDRDTMYALHLNLIRHGRETCRARAPACGRCILQEICPSAFSTDSGNRFAARSNAPRAKLE